MKNHNSILNPFSYLKRKGLQKQGTKAFTLVELIVVITILAILSTIGFVAYSGYLVGTRDTSRIASLKAISEGLEMYSTRHDLPTPDEKTTKIMSGSTQIATQGYVGENVLETITYSTEGVDPKDGTYYSYYLTKDKKYFQLMAFLEEEKTTTVYNPLVPLSLGRKAQAVDYSTRYPTVFGKKLGILTTKDNEPIQESTGTIDISNVGTLELKSYLKDNDYLSGTGTTFSKLGQVAKKGGKFWNVQNNELVYYNPNTDSSLNIADIFGDGSNIATYTFDGDTNDLNGNYNPDSTSNIGNYGDGKFGKGLNFDGVNNGIDFTTDPNFYLNMQKSISFWIKFNNVDDKQLLFQVKQDDGYTNFELIIQDTKIKICGRKDDHSNDSYSCRYTSNNGFEINKWYNIIYTTKDDGNYLYINGEKDGNFDFTFYNLPDGSSLQLLGYYDGESGYHLNGKIDQLRIFNRALTEDEIKKLYEEK